MGIVTLLGLDFGTTTSSALVASARLLRNSVTGHVEIAEVTERFRCEPIFTPYQDDAIDLRRLQVHLDSWLVQADVIPEQLFGGGALITGLAAQQRNTALLTELVRERLKQSVIACADDPRLESWLAFQGNCAGLAREYPETPIINLDIGGGTTNLALGQNSAVHATGCLFVGARHFQFDPGTYVLVRLSRYAEQLLEYLKIRRVPGDEMTRLEVEAVLDFYARLLEAAVAGRLTDWKEPVVRLHEQVAFQPVEASAPSIITFSGGVGELVYALREGSTAPTTTQYGDLGVDLAQRMCRSPRLSSDLGRYVPTQRGRATVYGLLRHATEISGSTIFLSNPALLPLTHLPILGQVTPETSDQHLEHLLDLVRGSREGGCLQIRLEQPALDAVRPLARRLSRGMQSGPLPLSKPLVLFVPQNLGKVLGQYITEWGTLAVGLVVIDELPVRDAQFARIGSPCGQVVPVSFYGMT